jgi:hypothetical protein
MAPLPVTLAYEDAYVQWLDDSESAECLEDRLAAGLALADAERALRARGLTDADVAEVQAMYRD